jgi:SAM-dependent methyltransferase
MAMPFYDNFTTLPPTGMGSQLARKTAINQMSLIRKYHSNMRDVLELGPGRGPFAEQCQQHQLTYTCADISARLLNALTHLPRRVRALVPPLPFASDQFDVAFAANFLEHMLDFRHAYDLVDEMKRVTRTGGLVCHCAPNAMEWGMQFWNGDYTHSFPTTPRRVAQLYLDLGLREIAIYPLSGPWMGPLAHLGNLIGKLIPVWFTGHGAMPTSKLTKALYSAKTTFLASFMIIGRKQDSHL